MSSGEPGRGMGTLIDCWCTVGGAFQQVIESESLVGFEHDLEGQENESGWMNNVSLYVIVTLNPKCCVHVPF